MMANPIALRDRYLIRLALGSTSTTRGAMSSVRIVSCRGITATILERTGQVQKVATLRLRFRLTPDKRRDRKLTLSCNSLPLHSRHAPLILMFKADENSPRPIQPH